MILIKSPAEIEKMRLAGRATAVVMQQLEKAVGSGISLFELEKIALDAIDKQSAKSAFKGYMGYPAAICASVNEEVVHGIPSHRKLEDGDIVGIDIGVVLDGYYGDMAKTFMIGRVRNEIQKLVRVTEESFYQGFEQCRAGRFLGDVSFAIEQWVVKHGFSVVRDFVGHGIGSKMHEDPAVPNYGKAGTGPKLCAGMVIAIEPMVNEGRSEVKILKDGWTAVTKDGRCSSHYEHTVAITNDAPEILTKVI